MNHFRVIARDGGQLRMISTAVDLVTATQLVRGLRHCGLCGEIVVSDRQWGEEAARLAMTGTTTHHAFPGHADDREDPCGK